MLYPVNRESAEVLDKIAGAPRLGDIQFEWTAGWHESADRKRGLFESASAVPETWDEVILQGPNLTVGTPLFKQSNETMRSNQDYAVIDLDKIDENFLPRTNYQVKASSNEFKAADAVWAGRPSASYYRLAWREMCDVATVRTLHSALIPPGPTHIHTVHSIGCIPLVDVVVASGIQASIVSDFFVKVSSSGHLKAGNFSKLPHVRDHPLEHQIVLRTLRLNCLVRSYAPLWEELFDRVWQVDSWVPHIGVDYSGRSPLGAVKPDWEWATPLRRGADRRQALVEIDAIVAIMLGITAEELLTIYRTQFPVLQKYERDALYDGNGRQLPGKLASEYRKKGAVKAEDLTVDGVTHVEPFVGVDRECDMELAHKHFSDIASA